MGDPTITITVKLFAAFQEAYDVPELERTVAAGTTVGDIFDQILAEKPELERWRSLTRFGVNLQFVPPETVLQPGDELVAIPPVSGG
ncbi:MAG: MoaD/ThiS family protein [Cyanobacteria bacterium P01_C01_bin.89]